MEVTDALKTGKSNINMPLYLKLLRVLTFTTGGKYCCCSV